MEDPFTDDKIDDLLSALNTEAPKQETVPPLQRSQSTTTTTISKPIQTPPQQVIANTLSMMEIKIIFTSIPANAEHPFEIRRGTQTIYKTIEEIPSTKSVAVKLQIPKPSDNLLVLQVCAPLIGVDAERKFDLVAKGCFIRFAIDADDTGEKMFTISQRSDDAFPYENLLLTFRALKLQSTSTIQGSNNNNSNKMITMSDIHFNFCNIPASPEQPFKIFINKQMVLSQSKNMSATQRGTASGQIPRTNATKDHEVDLLVQIPALQFEFANKMNLTSNGSYFLISAKDGTTPSVTQYAESTW